MSATSVRFFAIACPLLLVGGTAGGAIRVERGAQGLHHAGAEVHRRGAHGVDGGCGLGGLLGGELVHALEAYLPPLDAFDRFPGSSALAMQRLG